MTIYIILGPGSTVVKNSPANAGDIGDAGSIPRLGRPPGEGNGNLLQYFCLEKFMDRRAWGATAHGGHKESDTTEQITFSLSHTGDLPDPDISQVSCITETFHTEPSRKHILECFISRQIDFSHSLSPPPAISFIIFQFID